MMLLSRETDSLSAVVGVGSSSAHKILLNIPSIQWNINTVYDEIFAVFQFSRYFAVSMNPRKLKSRNVFLFLSKNLR